MRLPSRRTIWRTILLGSALILVVVASSGWFLMPRNRITDENVRLIVRGTGKMRMKEVRAILGGNEPLWVTHLCKDESVKMARWVDGPSYIFIEFRNDTVDSVS